MQCHMIILCTTLLPNLYATKLQHTSFKHVFSIREENSVDPDQLASADLDLHCFQRAQWLSGRVLDSRPRGHWFEPHQPHCFVVLEQDTFILAYGKCSKISNTLKLRTPKIIAENNF